MKRKNTAPVPKKSLVTKKELGKAIKKSEKRDEMKDKKQFQAKRKNK